MFALGANIETYFSLYFNLYGIAPNGVELASGKVAELVKSFEQVNEILDGFRYKIRAYPLNSTPFGIAPLEPLANIQPRR